MNARGKWPIITYYDRNGPWPQRYDWRAMRDSYEPPMPIGYGRTEQEAIDDLMGLEEETYERSEAA